MIKSYCSYALYNDDTSQCLEEGDYIDRITYWDGEKRITVEDVHITKITKDEIIIDTEDFDEISISIEAIEDWD